MHEAWESYVEEVRERGADLLVGICEESCRLFPAGRGTFKCASPIRAGDKDPSFYIYPEGRWYDFGTQESGDVLDFVRRVTNCSFRDAVDDVAKRAGLQTWDERKKSLVSKGISSEDRLEQWKNQEEGQSIRRAMTDLVSICHQTMPTRVRDFIKSHYKYSDAFIDEERIGYVPAGLWKLAKELLVDEMGEPLYDDTVLLSTGFFLQVGGDVKAHLATRIIFPYWKAGHVVYTIGREHHFGVPLSECVVEDYDKGKYKKHLTHSPKHPYVASFVENNVPWGEDCLRNLRDKTVLIAEGMTDAGIAKMLGVLVISPITTRFRDQDIPRIAEQLKMARDVVIIFDNEEKDGKNPGMEGALDTAEAIYQHGVISCRVGEIPKAKGIEKIDLNEYLGKIVKESGEETARKALLELMSSAVPVAQRLLESVSPTAPTIDMEACIQRIGRLLVNASNVEVENITAKVKDRFKSLSKSVVRDALKQSRREAFQKYVEEKKERDANAASQEALDKKKRRAGVVLDQVCFYEKEVKGADAERISTFSLTLRRLVAQERGKPDLLCVDVTGLDGKMVFDGWAVPSRAWSSSKDFIRSFPSAAMQWTGTDHDVQHVYEMVAATAPYVPRVESTDKIGVHRLENGKVRFVTPVGTIDENGWMAQPDLVYISTGGSSIQNKYPKRQTSIEEGRAVLARALEASFDLYKQSLSVPAFAWFAASLFRPDWLERFSGFPHLSVTGTKGSGKTSFLLFVWRLFAGLEPKEPVSIKQTHFSILRDLHATTSIPIFFDEYKVSDLPQPIVQDLNRFLRRSYGGESESRGRADQSVITYRLTSPILIAGESHLDDEAAIRERCIFTTSDGIWLAAPSTKPIRARFREVNEQPLALAAPFIHRWRVRADPRRLIDRAESSANAFFDRMKRDAPIRVKQNISSLVLGAQVLSELADEAGAKLPKVDIDEVLVGALKEILGSDEDEQDEKPHTNGTATEPITATWNIVTRDDVDYFVIEASQMAAAGVIREDDDYLMIDGKLFLYVNGIESKRLVWRKEQGYTTPTIGIRSLQRLADEKKGLTYVIESKARGTLANGARVRGWLLDPDRLPGQLNILSFPCDRERRHGGKRRGTESAQETFERIAGKVSPGVN